MFPKICIFSSIFTLFTPKFLIYVCITPKTNNVLLDTMKSDICKVKWLKHSYLDENKSNFPEISTFASIFGFLAQKVYLSEIKIIWTKFYQN